MALPPKVLSGRLGYGENSSESALGHLGYGENSSESALRHLGYGKKAPKVPLDI